MQNYPAIHLEKPFPVFLPFPFPATSAQALENWRTLQKRISLARKLAQSKGQWTTARASLAHYCQQAYNALLLAHLLAHKERQGQAC